MELSIQRAVNIMHAPLLSRNNVRRLTGTLLLLTIICSMAIFVPPAASDITQGNNVSWQSQDETTQNSWDWTNQGWQFGPFPTFTVILDNGTEVTDDNYIPINQQFIARMDIQKSIFVGNATLGQAGLYWGTDLRSQNGSVTGNANCNMMYVNSLQGQGWNQSNIWNINSNVYNQSSTNDVNDPSKPQPMQQVGFFQFDSEASNITESDMGWRIFIVGSFNSSAPMGPYWVNMQITDQYNNWIDVNSRSGQAGSTNRQIAVGRGGFVFGGYQDYYTFEKVDIQNNPLMSVTKGALWKMRLNVTSTDFDNATIGLNLPWNIQQYVNVTSWYQKVITENGGWMYNETSDTYYWNSTAVVTRNQQVYGPHLEQRWISMTNSNHQVNRTYTMWNPVTNQNELVNQQMYVQDQLFLMFNKATETFSIKIGYSYDSYDINTQRYMQYQELRDLNQSDPTGQFYTLSLPDCSYTQTASNEHVVEFTGLFSNSTNYAQDQYQLQINVFTGMRQIWANWEQMDQTDQQVIVDRPVAISTILDSHGNPARTQSMFMISQSKPFIVESKIYGCSAVYQDMDAVGVSFYSNFGTWSETENSNSQVEIRLTKNLGTDAISSVSYNRTNVNRYVYGSHLGWAYVNVTDWHTEYNPTTGMWDWVESPHLIWNQTTLIDWHWEYYRLNQTQYAINPNSPNIWIDTTTSWVDDMDPAFVTPTSYANLNSANITLVNGVVVVDLGVTFDASAPQGNYWYNMIFQNMTYGQDPSQGWGQHRITEWTSESIYYINSDATGNQNWLVSTPSNPLFTVYNAQRYQVSQAPYITIDGQDYLIKPQVQYDQAQQRDWTQYLLTGMYDPSIARQTQYYELHNGTKIYIDQAYQTIIRTLQLTTANTYQFVGDSKVYLANETSIATYMTQATADYSKQYWNPGQGNVLPYYYELLNGSRVYYDACFEQSTYNSTTSHWERTNEIYTESGETLLVQSAGSGVKLNGTIVLLRDPGYWQNLPDGTGYYLVMKNGTRIIVANPYGVPDDQRLATINGVTYQVGWPNQYYQATYDGQTLLIPYNGPNNDYYVHSYYYTDLGVTGGEMFELPYSGAMATSWWDLQGIESSGQKLKTQKTITLDGAEVLLNFDSAAKTYYIEVGGERQTVSYPTVDNNNFYASINGEDYWTVTQNGWTVDYGTYSLQSNQLTSQGSLTTTTGYDPVGKTWSANRYGYDYENSTLYLTMPNRTRFDVTSTMTLAVWRVDVNGENYYTTDSGSSTESVIDGSGQSVFRNYFKTLNGDKVYFDWNSPANWIQEIHIPITGTNYTKLIPYNWQPQTAFDKVMIYNITIPEIGTTSHTGVYYQDGTEVAPDTAFKVIGSNYGPGTCYSFWQNGNTYNFDGAYMPNTQAPWNNSIYVGYFITLDGSRIYSPTHFGWTGDIHGIFWDPENTQWAFNGEAQSANVTVSVDVGGYAIYLNDTIKVDVTTNNIFGDSNGNYVVMTNGTRLEVQWINTLGRYFTVIGGQTCLFQSVVSQNTLTDGGVTYSIADPLVYDQRHLYTPSTYQAPAVSIDTSSYLTINATTSSMLHDEIGYYFIHAQDQSRIDVALVDDWWVLPELIRDQVFTNQQSDYYPRYNITIDGVEYFVLDPSPVVDRWNGEWSTQNAMYRYSNTVNAELGGVTYTIPLFQAGFSWFGNLTIRQVNTINIDGANYDVAEQYNWKPSYQVGINNQTVPLESETMNIYKTHESWGNIYTWRLTDLGISTTSQVSCLIVGSPQFGMWGIKAYKTVESSGAVDIDGDTTSSSDQYFVRRVHAGTESQTSTTERMMVNVDWNPNGSLVGDDIRLNAWMGQLQVSWTSQWSESYVWYHASDMSPVGSAEMLQIRDTMVNNQTQQPNPGYWDIAHMVRNQTWEDVLAQAEANNWDWINSNQNNWNWLWFGTDQNYNVDLLQNGMQTTAGVDLKYEFAGLNLLNGTEQTHYFMPKNVGDVSFVTPGEAFGNYNASGSMTLPLNSQLDFGVTYTDVNGTLFPYNEQRSMWGWWDKPIYGSDFNAPNLMNKPTTASADYLKFVVHFAGTQTDSQYNSASMKIDQWVGDWNLPSDVVDGRSQNSSGVMVPLVGNEVLQNRSLAINYYVTASTSMGWSVKDDSGSDVSNNNVTSSSQFNVTSLNNVNFASVKLGSTYDWGKPTTATDQIRTFNVTSQTTSIQNFQSSYQSDAGKSSTGFDISSSMYFLTQGFPSWDGYSIYNDPEVSVMVSKGTTPTDPSPTPTAPPTNNPNPTNSPSPTNQPSGDSNDGSSDSSSNPTPTTNPDNPNPTPTPQNTATPTPNHQTPKPTESAPAEIPSTIILVVVAVIVGVVIGSLVLVRVKKKN